MKHSKVAVMISQIVEKMQLILGILILFTFGLTTIMVLVDPQFFIEAEGEFGLFVMMVVMLLVFDAAGVFLIVCSWKRHKLIVDFRKYVAVLSHDPTGIIDNMAVSLNTPNDVVRKRLSQMIEKKYFVNAYIDAVEDRLVLSKSDGLENNQRQEAFHAGNSRIEYVTISCRGCGGLNKVVKGTKAECEYCGAMISDEKIRKSVGERVSSKFRRTN